jgi:threonylcarbamoyladenosine tRNA methylthiotransferase MtaB
MKKFQIVTLGCKVNQFESDGIAQSLTKKGWQQDDDSGAPQVLIVNTCAVTSKAGMQSRQAIRKLIRENPDAKVIVTGCHAQTDPDEIKKIEQVDALISHKDKTRIADHINAICEGGSAPGFHPVMHDSGNRFFSFDDTVKGSMTRAYLKIQDGCNSFCTYCIVPYARGGSVSMPQQEVLQHLDHLNRKGFKEVIITGIHTGLYGQDFSHPTDLTTLLCTINDQRPMHRIRLSSIEPGEITDGIIELAKPGNILCNHFHIPLQSGDDEVLTRMKRPYTAAAFEETILKIHETVPGVCIGLDTLIGFPGETDDQFQNSYELVRRLPIAYLHIFPFSRRKGTPAYHFRPQIDSRVIKERCSMMRALDTEKRRQFTQQNVGKKVEGLVQHASDPATGRLKAVTDNYLTLFLEADHGLKGKILDLIPEQCDSGLNMTGRLADNK